MENRGEKAISESNTWCDSTEDEEFNVAMIKDLCAELDECNLTQVFSKFY
jgi:hypothetical protein